TKGLWMECATYSTGITQCDIYSSLLNLPADIQAAQALMVSSCAVSSLACLLAIVGMRCTVFSQGSPEKDRVAVAGGAAFILGGLLCFIPLVWNIHVVLRDFRNPVVPDSMKFELGEALYLGIISSLLSLIGGFILCTSCPAREPSTTYTYQPQLLASKSPQPSVSQMQKPKSDVNSYNLTGYV
ncbi:CLD2 protein, partial [Neodrepanis coruscans]|nr:CLD2 protein [Neodrepanis coruscans]